MELIELERTTDAIDWEDLAPKCEGWLHKVFSNPAPPAKYLTNWEECECYKGKERFLCEPCVHRIRTCPYCGARGYQNIIGVV